MEAYRIENAIVRREGKEILSIPHFSASLGEKIAIVGPNGAGKSTFLSVLAKKVYPLASESLIVRILEEENWIVSELRLRISLISPSEDIFYNTRYKALEIVASGLRASLGFDFHHSVSCDEWDKALKELEKANLSHLKDRPFDTLSTGEKRRVLLARAAVTKPEIWLLDEASSGLDFPSRAVLRNAVSAYTEDKTVIMVTHELSEIPPSVKRVLLMKDGRIVFDGKKEDALTKEMISGLFGFSISIAKENEIYSAFC